MATETTEKAVEKNSERPSVTPKTFPDFLKSYKSEIARALPRHLTADRMTRIALTEFRKNPLLAKCDPASLFGAIVICSQMGLEPGVFGQAWLLPFWNSNKKIYEVQLIPGYKGFIKLAKNSGEIKSLEARVVWSNDKFEVSYGHESKLIHVPNLDGDRGSMRLAYLYVEFKDGGHYFEVLTKADIEGIKARSKSRNKEGKLVGPWVTDEEPMWRKSAIRRGSNYLNLSPEMVRAIELDDASAMGDSQHLDDVLKPEESIDAVFTKADEEAEQKSPTEELKEKLKGKPEKSEPAKTFFSSMKQYFEILGNDTVFKVMGAHGFSGTDEIIMPADQEKVMADLKVLAEDKNAK